MNVDTEVEFINQIDCNFPYSNKEACLSLINKAATLSPNAMFAVIEEICRIPISDKENVSNDFLIGLLDQTKTKFNHPLRDLVLDVAKKMIQEQTLSVEEAISGMQKVRNYKGQHAALSILYFSCEDSEQRLESIWDDIIQEWNKNDT